MKTVCIIDEHKSSETNGVGTYIQELIICLKDICSKVYLIALNSENKEFTIRNNDQIEELIFPYLPQPFSTSVNFVEKMLRLHITDSSENLFIVNHTPCEKLLERIKTSFPLSKLLFVIHNMQWVSTFFGDKEKFKKNIRENEDEYENVKTFFEEEKRMYAIVDKVVALSSETYDLLTDVYSIDKSKLSLINNGLREYPHWESYNAKEEEFRSKFSLYPDERIILYVGYFWEYKGCYNLLKSFRNVLEVNKNVRLVVVGRIIDIKYTLHLSKDITSRITFTGQISRDELFCWYKVADIGILPSYTEQCSYSGIEMMMSGLPIVASDGFGMSEMFRDNCNAKVARIEDRNKPELYENNLAKAINELLNSSQKRKNIAKDARKTYEDKYKIDIMQEKYKNLLNELFV